MNPFVYRVNLYVINNTFSIVGSRRARVRKSNENTRNTYDKVYEVKETSGQKGPHVE